MLSKFKKSILRWTDKFFQDESLRRTITYTLYKGRDNTQSFQIIAVLHFHQVGDKEFLDVPVQQAERRYMIRESDLPSGVTVASLTRNDTITDSGLEFTVVEINKTLEFLIEIIAMGDA